MSFTFGELAIQLAQPGVVLALSGNVEGPLTETAERCAFRGLDGEWKPLHLSVALMAFDESTHGGLVTVAEAPAARE
ncbi:hypothetical protein ABI214_14670 [Prescottella soli]|uniref:Uncharacterized protein n=1 Tax=Prescottella soli TaxID=1543852 RepID=A0ABW9FZE1_9NOCA